VADGKETRFPCFRSSCGNLSLSALEETKAEAMSWQPGGERPDPRVEELAQAILSTASDAIVAADANGLITFWNPGAERVFGHLSAQAIGQSLDIIIPERLRKRHWDGYYHVMNGGQSRYESGDILAVPAIKVDGTRISVEFTIVPLRHKTGYLTGLVAIIRDVTKRFEEVQILKRKLAAAKQTSL
jgi:PAS domain S-box-containing protein